MSRPDSSRLYVVRRDGKVHFEGDLASLRAWLADNRIKGDDEVRRQGYEVLESQRLWGLIRDREELGFDPTAERASLGLLRQKTRRVLVVGGLALVAAISLFVVNHYLPRFEAAAAIQVAKEEEVAQIQKLSANFALERSALQKSLAEVEAKLEVIKKDKVSETTSNITPKERMVSIAETATYPDVSARPLYNWISQSGIRIKMSANNQSFTLVEDGGEITLSGNFETGVFLSYSKSFKVSYTQEDFPDFLTAILIINTAIRSGKVVVVSETELEYRFSSLIAANTPATVIERFLLECRLGSSGVKGGLKDFLR